MITRADTAERPVVVASPRPGAATASQPLIVLQDLVREYYMGASTVRALDGVSLSVTAGEFIAITGPSGSGKSTMMHLLGCLDRPTRGAYRLSGRDVSNLTDGELAEVRNTQIGFVFQVFNLINRTSALDNVAVPLFYARKANIRGPALEALRRVGLEKRAHHKPNELSGGERQRVAIARAIVNEPMFLLADEPTGNLDSRTGEQIMRIFHDLNAQGVTIVLVTHEPDIAVQARRVVQMHDGRIISDGPAENWRPESGRSHAGGAGSSAADVPEGPQSSESPPNGVAPGASVPLPGGRKALVFGVVASVLLGASYALGYLVQHVPSWKIEQYDPSKPISGAALAANLSTVALWLFSLVTGVIAWILAARALGRARQQRTLVHRTGPARIGRILGIITIFLPLAVFVFRMIRRTGG